MEVQVSVRKERKTGGVPQTDAVQTRAPHETRRAGADAHGQRTLLNKSDGGGDADTQRLRAARREKCDSASRCEVFCSVFVLIDALLDLGSYILIFIWCCILNINTKTSDALIHLQS